MRIIVWNYVRKKLMVLTRIEESTPASYDRSVKKKLNIVYGIRILT